jgi:hypothetical protein
MTQIAFLLLCHKDPEGIIAQALRLTAAGDSLAIHFDARASAADYDRIRSALGDNPRVTFARRRQKCGWGEWSLVAATIEAAKAAVDAFPAATHFYMLSGDCMPIKTAEHIRAELEAADVDYIESFDFHASDWIKTGIKEERLVYRHWFNERQRKAWFYRSLDLQRRLGLKRETPEGMQIRIGSQWWCLRRRTMEAVLDFAARRRDVVRFFRTTWIPDETFFQTIVAHLIPGEEIRSQTLTFLMFTDYGLPVTFYDDHFDLLLAQGHLFARKISPDAHALKQRLGELYLETGRQDDSGGDGRRQFQYLTQRGRTGRRFGPRFWEADTSLGRGRVLLVIVSKKWHVAKRLVERIRSLTEVPAVEYIFNELSSGLPDLGGIETSLAKRSRHRRAVLRMVFEQGQNERLVICTDPAGIDLIQDVYSDKAEVRLLELDCDFSDEYLVGHAQRVGLANAQTPASLMDQLLTTVRHDLRFESERLRDLGLARHFRLRQSGSLDENARALADFLGLPEDTARTIAETDYLFVD